MPFGCPHFPACAGCPWVGRPYSAQLATKEHRVAAALTAVGIDPRALVAPVEPSPTETGYRVQTKLMVGHTASGPVLGLYAPGSHRIVDASRCPLHDPLLQRVIPAVRDALAAAGIAIHGRGRSGVRYVLMRASVAEGRVLVALVSSQVPLAGVQGFVRRLRSVVPLAGLLLNENTTSGNVIVGARTTRVWGEPTLRERYGELTLAAGPTAFVQANTRMAAHIYSTIAAAIDSTIAAAVDHRPETRVLDLYCGVGGIALTVAPLVGAVTGVEEVAAAVEAARANAQRGGIRHARFIAARVEDALAALEDTVDVVTLNPPRKGCGETVARRLGVLAPSRVLYLSCNPESFARDAQHLGAAGFTLARVQPFDLLPQTDHVELLGSFRR